MHYRWSVPTNHPLNILQGIGNGCALLDYDQDGRLDILLIGPHIALYHGDGHGRFADVSRATGLSALSGHFLGCAVGDYDNDGYPDLYVTGYRTGVLLHNEPAQASARRFHNVTAAAGLRPQPWGTSAQFWDLDGDGRLDLYVGNYVQFGPGALQLCDYHGVKAGCGPTQYWPLKGKLYRNLGNGKFRDETVSWRLDRVAGRTLGVAAAPAEAGEAALLALANDETPGDLVALHAGRSRDVAAEAGTALLTTGQPYGGMGLDWGDYDNDGRLDLFIATYQDQPKLVLHNDGATFSDRSTTVGIASAQPYVAFGAKWLDFDNDGWLDLLIANGHIWNNVSEVDLGLSPAGTPQFREPILFFQNIHGRRLENATDALSARAQTPIVGRGLATGDYDNDGAMDALVVDSDGSPVLLHNVGHHRGHWVELKLVGRRSNRDGIGALVTVQTGGLRQTRLCTTGGSYLSASDVRVHIGLGAATSASVQVRWPSGRVRHYGELPADHITSLME